MPTIQRAVSIPANSTVDNIIGGSQYEFAKRRCAISGGLVAAAAGLIGNVNSGGDVVMEPAPLQVLATDFPIIPDNINFNDVMEASDRLTITVQNTTGAAIVARVLIQIQDF
jgi:hypothetical protein